MFCVDLRKNSHCIPTQYQVVDFLARSQHYEEWLSVLPQGATRFPKEGFSWNLIFEYFFRKSVFTFDLNVTRIMVLYLKTNTHIWSYLAEFFSKREMLPTKVVEKIKTIWYSIFPPPRKSCRLWDNVEKYGTARQATGENIMWGKCFACWITKATDIHSEYLTLIVFPRQQWLH